MPDLLPEALGKGLPVADLWSLNAWMAARQQAHFQQFLTLTEQEPQPPVQ
jgi:hypothetical protein